MDRVECRSDSDYAERPVALYWQGERLEILEIQGRWRTPEGRRFWVRTVDHQTFDLFFSETEELWRIQPR